jgi:hypothetical protein
VAIDFDGRSVTFAFREFDTIVSAYTGTHDPWHQFPQFPRNKPALVMEPNRCDVWVPVCAWTTFLILKI